MTLYLDPSNQLSIVRKGSARLSLEFNLAASNVVNLTQKTVTVTPLMAASAAAIDSKVVRIRGVLGGVSTSNTDFSSGIQPFDFATAGTGSLQIVPSNVTTYEINGKPSTGSAGLADLAELSPGAMVESFGTLTTSTSGESALDGTTTTGTTETCSDGTTPETVNGVLECADGATLVATGTTGTTETCSDGTTPETVNGVLECADGATLVATNNNETTNGTIVTSVSFSAAQVLAGSSAQGWGFDRVSGIVTGRSGDTLTVDDGTLVDERRHEHAHRRDGDHPDRPQHGSHPVRRRERGIERLAADFGRLADLRLWHRERGRLEQRHARCQRRPGAPRTEHRLGNRRRSACGGQLAHAHSHHARRPLDNGVRFSRHRHLRELGCEREGVSGVDRQS